MKITHPFEILPVGDFPENEIAEKLATLSKSDLSFFCAVKTTREAVEIAIRKLYGNAFLDFGTRHPELYERAIRMINSDSVMAIICNPFAAPFTVTPMNCVSQTCRPVQKPLSCVSLQVTNQWATFQGNALVLHDLEIIGQFQSSEAKVMAMYLPVVAIFAARDQEIRRDFGTGYVAMFNTVLSERYVQSLCLFLEQVNCRTLITNPAILPDIIPSNFPDELREVLANNWILNTDLPTLVRRLIADPNDHAAEIELRPYACYMDFEHIGDISPNWKMKKHNWYDPFTREGELTQFLVAVILCYRSAKMGLAIPGQLAHQIYLGGDEVHEIMFDNHWCQASAEQVEHALTIDLMKNLSPEEVDPEKALDRLFESAIYGIRRDSHDTDTISDLIDIGISRAIRAWLLQHGYPIPKVEKPACDPTIPQMHGLLPGFQMPGQMPFQTQMLPQMQMF